jgi:hypothetical protein
MLCIWTWLWTALKFTSSLQHRYTYSYSLHRFTPYSTHHHSNQWFSSHQKNSHSFKGFNSINIPPTRIQYIRSIEGFTQLKEYCKNTYVMNGPIAIIVPFNYIYILLF